MIDVDAYCEIDLSNIKVEEITFRYFKVDQIECLKMRVLKDQVLGRIFEDFYQFNQMQSSLYNKLLY